jgi:hypothetical protein
MNYSAVQTEVLALIWLKELLTYSYLFMKDSILKCSIFFRSLLE